MREILLIDLQRPKVEVWSKRLGGVWAHSAETKLDKSIELSFFRGALSLDEIYALPRSLAAGSRRKSICASSVMPSTKASSTAARSWRCQVGRHYTHGSADGSSLR
ncbi:MAG: hypothetical protein U0Q16_34765 [Bryobacteraceae bacterium]